MQASSGRALAQLSRRGHVASAALLQLAVSVLFMIWSARRADLAWYMPDAPFWYALQVPFVFAGLLVITASRRKPRSAARLQTLYLVGTILSAVTATVHLLWLLESSDSRRWTCQNPLVTTTFLDIAACVDMLAMYHVIALRVFVFIIVQCIAIHPAVSCLIEMWPYVDSGRPSFSQSSVELNKSTSNIKP